MTPERAESTIAERLRALATAHSIELDGDFVLNHEEQELVTAAASHIESLRAELKEAVLRIEIALEELENRPHAHEIVGRYLPRARALLAKDR